MRLLTKGTMNDATKRAIQEFDSWHHLFLFVFLRIFSLFPLPFFGLRLCCFVFFPFLPPRLIQLLHLLIVWQQHIAQAYHRCAKRV